MGVADVENWEMEEWKERSQEMRRGKDSMLERGSLEEALQL